VSACADSSESSSLPDGSVAVAGWSTGPAWLRACSVARSCARSPPADRPAGHVETDGATDAKLGRGVVAARAEDARRGRPGRRPRGEVRAVTLEAPSGGRGALLVGGARIEQDPERSLKIVASSDGEEALVTVHRGSALALTGDAPTPIDKGQSLRVALDSKAPLRTAYEPPRAALEAPIVAEARPVQRGLGRMTARLPGQSSVVEGRARVAHGRRGHPGGIATTTVEEVFHNETDRVLEGRLCFPFHPTRTSRGSRSGSTQARRGRDGREAEGRPSSRTSSTTR
jgi:hypothetical protein